MDHEYPNADQSTDYYHYTSYAAFESILKTNEIWLYSLLKRIGHGEYIESAFDLDLNGYLVNGDRTVRHLCADLFYLSLTTDALSRRDVG